jgi:hypothetical protein
MKYILKSDENNLELIGRLGKIISSTPSTYDGITMSFSSENVIMTKFSLYARPHFRHNMRISPGVPKMRVCISLLFVVAFVGCAQAQKPAEKPSSEWSAEKMAEWIAGKLKEKGYAVRVSKSEVNCAIKDQSCVIMISKQLTPELAKKDVTSDQRCSWDSFLFFVFSFDKDRSKEDLKFSSDAIKMVKSITSAK